MRDSCMANYLKQEMHKSEKWRRAVADLDCVACGSSGTQAAHRNEGKGMGMKVDDCLTAALCPDCHRAIDQGKLLNREERRSLMDSYILKTLVQLARRGRLSVT